MNEVQTLSLDLGPRGLIANRQQMGGMSSTDLHAINTYVEELNLAWSSIPNVRIPGELKEMSRVSLHWQSQTYLDIRNMAVCLADYGYNIAPARYDELRFLRPALQADPRSVRRQLARLFNDLAETCKEYVDQTRSVVESIGDFARTLEPVERYITQQINARQGNPTEDWEGPIWSAVTQNQGNPRVALSAAQRIFGVWQSLYTDLLEVQETTKTLMDSQRAFIINVHITRAIEQWKTVGDGALDFRLAMDAI